MRVGQGFDAHRFGGDERPLIVGGVEIPGRPGLEGHSDADVLSHAVADALLGATKLGDLGRIFPASDRWRDASSLDILTETARLVRDAGFQIGNVDATVIAEAPRIGPFREAMEAKIADALGIPVDRVSVKATTTDGMGPEGRGEGMSAAASVLVTS